LTWSDPLKTTKAGGFRRPLKSIMPRGYRSGRVRCTAGCIMTAATLRQTAAPDANVKSEIHMAPSLLFR
jgi:hypothetical protein